MAVSAKIIMFVVVLLAMLGTWALFVYLILWDTPTVWGLRQKIGLVDPPSS